MLYLRFFGMDVLLEGRGRRLLPLSAGAWLVISCCLRLRPHPELFWVACLPYAYRC